MLIGGDFLYKRLFDEVMGFDVIYPDTMDECMRTDVDLVIFTGGEDVHPNLYKGIHTNVSWVNESRDAMEQIIFKYYLKHGIKMTGICRGLQIMNVLCGGQMYQHITNHNGFYHRAFFPRTNKTFVVSSTHHQMVLLPSDAYPVAWSSTPRSLIYIGPMAVKVSPPQYEIEAAVFPKFNCFGVQFHPEIMNTKEEDTIYYCELINDFLRMNINSFADTYGYKGDTNVCKAEL